jgi:hypothetical protein
MQPENKIIFTRDGYMKDNEVEDVPLNRFKIQLSFGASEIRKVVYIMRAKN